MKILGLPWVVFGILAVFYTLGLSALITGVTWSRWHGRIEGAPARWGGIAVLVMGGLFTLLVYRPELESVLLVLICAWPLAAALFGRRLLTRRREEFARLQRVRPVRRKVKARRKRGNS
jgi:hypothetical protein